MYKFKVNYKQKFSVRYYRQKAGAGSTSALTLGAGFTLLEMLVVIGIIASLATYIIANYNSWRAGQGLRQAQSELVTALQTFRSHSLSARQVGGSQAGFYYIKLDRSLAARGQYQVGAVTKVQVGQSLTYQDTPLETVNFANGVTVSELEAAVPVGEALASKDCVNVIFSLPYGQTYINDSCAELIDQVSSLSNLSAISNGILEITLAHSREELGTKKIRVNGVSGLVCEITETQTCE